jgi:uncharacterized protein YndB with AHSA1/START domain
MGQGKGDLRIKREFDAPLDRVFRAWSEPDDLARWAWGSIGQEVVAEVDFRVGGSFAISTAQPEGERWSFSGEYTEIAPGERIAHTLHWDAPMGYTSTAERVTVEFSPMGGRTLVVFRHAGVPGAAARKGHEKGWANTFDTLAALLELEPRAHG